MNTAPVYKGIFTEPGGKLVHAFFVKHEPDAGETHLDDCMVTVSIDLSTGAAGCGESGLWTMETFKESFNFVKIPLPPNKKSGK